MRSWGWALIQPDQCPYKKRWWGKKKEVIRHRRWDVQAQRKTLREHNEKAGIHKPRKEAWVKINLLTFVLDFWPPELWDIHSCYVNHPVCVTDTLRLLLTSKYRDHVPITVLDTGKSRRIKKRSPRFQRAHNLAG